MNLLIHIESNIELFNETPNKQTTHDSVYKTLIMAFNNSLTYQEAKQQHLTYLKVGNNV
jgi:hypothetical protein